MARPKIQGSSDLHDGPMSSNDDKSKMSAIDDTLVAGCCSASKRRADCAIVPGFPKYRERGNRQLLHLMRLLKVLPLAKFSRQRAARAAAGFHGPFSHAAVSGRNCRVPILMRHDLPLPEKRVNCVGMKDAAPGERIEPQEVLLVHERVPQQILGRPC